MPPHCLLSFRNGDYAAFFGIAFAEIVHIFIEKSKALFKPFRFRSV
jgi:hypothetical protein